MEEGDLEGVECDIISLMFLYDELGDMELKMELLFVWVEVKIMKFEFQVVCDYVFVVYQVVKEWVFLCNKKQVFMCLVQVYQGLGKLDSVVYFVREVIFVQEFGQMYFLNQDVISLFIKFYV